MGEHRVLKVTEVRRGDGWGGDSPRRPRVAHVPLMVTCFPHARPSSISNKMEKNQEHDRVKRGISVVPSLVQPSIALLTWLQKYRECSVQSVLTRRIEQAPDTLCLGAGESPPRTTLIR